MLRACIRTGSSDIRYRLFEGVCDLLEAIARGGETGLVLLLDDLRWADRPSLLLLQHLSRRLAGVPLLVVAAYRTTEGEPSTAFIDTLATLARAGTRVPLMLTGLSCEEATTLASHIAGFEVAEGVGTAIERSTEGNPFFIGEVVRHLQAEGRDLSDPEALSSSTVPELVRQVIAARLSRLRPATKELLRQAAVLGDGFTFEVVRTARDCRRRPPLRRSRSRWRQANEPEMLARAAPGLGGMEFTPGVVDQTLVELLQEALAALDIGDSVVRARALARLALELRFSEVDTRSTARSDAAMEMAERVSDTLALGLALRAKQLALQMPDDEVECVPVIDALERLARETGNQELYLHSNWQRSYDALQRGDIVRFDAMLADSERIAQELRHHYYRWWCSVYRAMRALMDGDQECCVQVARHALSLGQRMNSEAAMQANAWQMFSVR